MNLHMHTHAPHVFMHTRLLSPSSYKHQMQMPPGTITGFIITTCIYRTCPVCRALCVTYFWRGLTATRFADEETEVLRIRRYGIFHSWLLSLSIMFSRLICVCSLCPFLVTAVPTVGVSTVGHPQSSPGLAFFPGAPRLTVTLPGPGESSALSRPQFLCLQN